MGAEGDGIAIYAVHFAGVTSTRAGNGEHSMSGDQPTVWVLGAGFSKSLGGPLLTELFTEKPVKEVLATFPDSEELNSKACQIARTFYWRHRPPTTDVPLWSNAEEYLDRLDSAAKSSDGSVSKTIMREYLMAFGVDFQELTLDEISVAARRWLAAECSVFVKNSDPNTERWRPYRAWMISLKKYDTIITFNYDLVLETLAKITQTQSKFAFLTPGGARYDVAGSSRIDVFKLHGSVNWHQISANVVGISNDDYFALNCGPHELKVATPGPTKMELTEGWRKYWSDACVMLENAGRINYVGYRFPETDTTALAQLLCAVKKRCDAVRESCDDQNSITLPQKIVLGPDINATHVRRLDELLQVAASRDGGVCSVPLWAEDFLLLEALQNRGPV